MGIFGKIKRGIVFIVSAPAGTGKTTLVEMLLAEYPNEMARSVSCTTRAPRGEEEEGVDYLFLTQADFEKKIAAGAFLEYAKVFNHYYGTLKETVTSIQASGKHVFLVIDTQGALYLKDKIDAVFVFITPPSLQTLRERLERRHTDAEEVINLRLSHAEKEIAQAKHYDYVIMNDDLKQGYQALKELVGMAERKLCQYMH